MSSRLKTLIVAALSVAVLAGLAYLALGVNEETEIDPDDARLARAAAAHRRLAASAARPPSTTVTPRPARTPTEPAARPETRPRPAARPRPEAPGIPQPKEVPGAAVAERLDISPGTQEFVAAMDDVNALYDRGDYIGALDAAQDVLQVQPNNVRMLRVAVSSHCILGNHEDAQVAWEQLPSRDQRQLSRRCERYGVEFEK